MMLKILKILYLEDNPHDVALVHRELLKAGISFSMDVVSNRNDYIFALKNFEPDIILSDHGLASFDSLEAFELMRGSGEIPFIMVSGYASPEFEQHCRRSGMSAYILKDDLTDLATTVKKFAGL